MKINFLGHSSFRIKSKNGIVIMDPYRDTVGFKMPKLSADVVTISHHHNENNFYEKIKPTKSREKPFVIDTPGEYEVSGISIFGIESFHDDQNGAIRGKNTIFVIYLDHLKICHLGHLGHELDPDLVAKIGDVDIVFVPVGGSETIDPKQAINVVDSLEPSIFIPMNYLTDKHSSDYAHLAKLEDFFNVYGNDVGAIETLDISVNNLPEERTLVVLDPIV